MYFDAAWLRRDTPLGLAWAAGNTLAGRTPGVALATVMRRHALALRRVSVAEIWSGAGACGFFYIYLSCFNNKIIL